jgi:electron transfer flavoprotein alpha subunit
MKSFIYIEHSEEGTYPIAKQIALRLKKVPATVHGPLVGIGIGSQLKGKESEFQGLLDELIIVEAPAELESNAETISKILTDVVSENGPGILFLGFTFEGMELGPSVGWRLNVPVVTNCVGFEWMDGWANVLRPIHGGKLLVSLKVNLERGAVISVPKGAWKEEEGSEKADRPVVMKLLPWRNPWAAEKTEVIGISEEHLEGEEDITKAEILVSIGRGLGDVENLPIVKELADKLGGMVSCSRPVVDLGWLPMRCQVGISGRTVAPALYLALGISGQGNHLAGMDGSRMIIAVNKDPLAPIFNAAHYGVVDDILQFIPELLNQLKQMSKAPGK